MLCGVRMVLRSLSHLLMLSLYQLRYLHAHPLQIYHNNSATALASTHIGSVHTLQVVTHTAQRTVILLQL
jgi:hypothetical protein